jgi:hypothetical protein
MPAGVLIAIVLVLGVVVFYAGLTLYSYRLLPAERRTTVDGVTTINDAVRACRESGKTGWDLVEYAQRLTARKFTYSRRNHWDRPARAFERGMGYCMQQAFALKLLYDRLGIEAWPVQSFRIRSSGGLVHGITEPGRISGHAWLHVRVDGEVRDVCPGNEQNRPGELDFEILSPVHRFLWFSPPLWHLGCVPANVFRDVSARRRARRSAGADEAG